MVKSVGILRSEFSDHSVKRLCEEIKNKNKNLLKLKIPNLYLSVHPELDLDIKSKNASPDVVIPMIDDRNFTFGIIGLRHIEGMGIPVVNNVDSILTCKNKYLTNVAFRRKKIPQPDAAIAYSAKDMIKHLAKLKKPFVLKFLDGSYGTGISKLTNLDDASDWIRTFNALHQPLYIQEYIEHHGHDYRVMVVGNQVIGAEKRIAKKGQWKTNVALGADVENFKPNKKIQEIAIKASEAVGTDVCGVDMIINDDRVYVIEANSFPRFKGLEKATGKNIGRKVVEYAIKKARK